MRRRSKFCEHPEAGARYAVAQLLKRERIRGPVYLPDHEHSAFIDVLHDNGNAVCWDHCDFLSHNRGETNVIAEPHPTHGLAYARHGLNLCTAKIALLLPVVIMATNEAKKFTNETPLSRVYMITRQLHYRRYPIAWWVWEKGHFSRPLIEWL